MSATRPVAELVVRKLAEDDDRQGFESGDEALDRFFHRYAGQNQFRHHVGVTYVATSKGSILGYITVAAASIELLGLPGRLRTRLPRYPAPVLRIARLATAATARGMGVGSALLRHAFRMAREMREALGCVGVIVDAKPGAIDFYSKFGFELIPDGPSPVPGVPRMMFLVLDGLGGP